MPSSSTQDPIRKRGGRPRKYLSTEDRNAANATRRREQRRSRRNIFLAQQFKHYHFITESRSLETDKVLPTQATDYSQDLAPSQPEPIFIIETLSPAQATDRLQDLAPGQLEPIHNTDTVSNLAQVTDQLQNLVPSQPEPVLDEDAVSSSAQATDQLQVPAPGQHLFVFKASTGSWVNILN